MRFSSEVNIFLKREVHHMKNTQIYGLLLLTACALAFQGCQPQSTEAWENTKSASRYMSRGVKAIAGKHTDSRQVNSADEFGVEEIEAPQGGSFQSREYVPLDEVGGQDVAMNDDVVRQPAETPGEAGSSIPGIDAFQDPSTVPGLAPIFKNVRFEYNSSLVKGSENQSILDKVATYLKSHGDTYVFIEGHADERGPEAYNLALGTRRSNAIRSYLASAGVNPDQMFTISYGKERPLVFGNSEESWAQNRRAEFKVYQR